MFNAEYPMIRWLERNGYDVSYTTGVDTDRRGALIRNHRVFLSVGHDEYWSGDAARERRGGARRGREPRVLQRQRGLLEDALGGRPPDAGLLQGDAQQRQDRPAAGVVDRVVARSAAVQPRGRAARERAHRHDVHGQLGRPRARGARRRTAGCACGAARGVASQAAAGQTSTLAPSTRRLRVGRGPRQRRAPRRPGAPVDHDRRRRRGAAGLRPHLRGRHGDPPPDALPRHQRRRPDALVFGAGTVQWSWGLDSDHDRGSAGAPTPRCSRPRSTCSPTWATQPGSLQPGLAAAAASTDTQAPSTSITRRPPARPCGRGAGHHDRHRRGRGRRRVGAVEVSVDGGASWHPASGRESWSYTLDAGAPRRDDARSRAADDSANLGAPASVTVNVPAQDLPVHAVRRRRHAGKPCTSDGRADRARRALPRGRGRAHHRAALLQPRRLGHASATCGPRRARGSPRSRSPPPQGWHEVALADARDGHRRDHLRRLLLHGRRDLRATPTTSSSAPTTPPPLHAPRIRQRRRTSTHGGGFPNTTSSTATNYFADVAFVATTTRRRTSAAVSPADGATGVDPGTTVTASFDESIEPSSVNASTFQLRDGTGAAVPADVSYSAATRTATLRPRSRAAGSITYSAVVKGGAGGVRDTSANALAQDRAWSFTTVPAPAGRRRLGEGGSSGGSGPGGGAGSPGGGAAARALRPRHADDRPRVAQRHRRLRVSCPRQAGRCRVKLRLALGRKLTATRTITVTGGRPEQQRDADAEPRRPPYARAQGLAARCGHRHRARSGRPDGDHTNLDPPAGASELTSYADDDQHDQTDAAAVAALLAVALLALAATPAGAQSGSPRARGGRSSWWSIRATRSATTTRRSCARRA